MCTSNKVNMSGVSKPQPSESSPDVPITRKQMRALLKAARAPGQKAAQQAAQQDETDLGDLGRRVCSVQDVA